MRQDTSDSSEARRATNIAASPSVSSLALDDVYDASDMEGDEVFRIRMRETLKVRNHEVKRYR